MARFRPQGEPSASRALWGLELANAGHQLAPGWWPSLNPYGKLTWVVAAHSTCPEGTPPVPSPLCQISFGFPLSLAASVLLGAQLIFGPRRGPCYPAAATCKASKTEAF